MKALEIAYKSLEHDLMNRFSAAVSDFEAENTTIYQIKVQRVQNFLSAASPRMSSVSKPCAKKEETQR